MSMVLIQLKVAPGEADFDVQKNRLRLSDGDVDDHFGLRRIDPAHGVYAMKVKGDLIERLTDVDGVAGPFANPRIQPATQDRSREPVRHSGAHHSKSTAGSGSARSGS